MKKFLSALMAIVLAISTALAASAAFDSRTAENSTVEIPTLYFDSAEAYERHLNQLKSDVSTHANGNAVISAAVVRSGSSEDCELYIEWDGNAVYSSFRYKQITVKTTSIHSLNPVGRVPARMNLGQLNSSRVIMAHRDQVFDSWCRSWGCFRAYRKY